MAELIGKDFTPPDVRAKVTGAAKYSEDFRMDGMLHCRLLKSPMPHAIVRSIDANQALELPGVVAILTADEVPIQSAPGNNILTNEPHFIGEPILAVAAESEEAAQNAIDAIKLDLELRQLLFHLIPHLMFIVPIKTHASDFVLHAVCLDQAR